MAHPLRPAGLPIALPAPHPWGMAGDRLLRLLGSQCCRVPVSRLRRQDLHPDPTGLVRRGRHHALAAHHGRQGTAPVPSQILKPSDFLLLLLPPEFLSSSRVHIDRRPPPPFD